MLADTCQGIVSAEKEGIYSMFLIVGKEIRLLSGIMGHPPITFYWIFFWIFLLGAALSDIRTRKIPNWWLCGGLAAGLLWEVNSVFWMGGGLGNAALESAAFLIRAASAPAVLSVLFVCRMIGAGDIKLIGIMLGWLGFRTGVTALGFGFFLGAVMAFLKLLLSGSMIMRFGYFFAYIRQTFRTRKITAYYRPQWDGYEVTIPLSLFLLAGAAAAAGF